jgi:hypothetical protein
MNPVSDINWLSEPIEHDYGAAENFLQLFYKPKDCRAIVKKLRRAKMSTFSAKDILRASDASLAEIKLFDWSGTMQEITDGKALAPILLVRQDNGARLLVADGFHRMCALFVRDEQISVPCKIV